MRAVLVPSESVPTVRAVLGTDVVVPAVVIPWYVIIYNTLRTIKNTFRLHKRSFALIYALSSVVHHPYWQSCGNMLF